MSYACRTPGRPQISLAALNTHVGAHWDALLHGQPVAGYGRMVVNARRLGERCGGVIVRSVSTLPCLRRVARNRVGHVIHEAHWQRSALTPARGWGGLRRCRVDMGRGRCQFEGCIKLAAGSTSHCIAHGGGRRCQKKGCARSARGATKYCYVHDGGVWCGEDGCDGAGWPVPGKSVRP